MAPEAAPLLANHPYLHDQELGYGGIPTARNKNSDNDDDICSNQHQQQQQQQQHNNNETTEAIQTRQGRLLLAMFLILPYIGIVLSLLAANNFDQETVIERKYFLPFHMYEFWGAVYFAFVEAYILLVADESSFRALDPSSQTWLVHLTSINVVSAVTAAALLTLDPSMFEVPAHYIEYASQFTVTLMDAFFMVVPRNGSNNLRRSQQRSVGDRIPIWTQQCFFVLLLVADVAKIILYTGIIPTAIGTERSTHYVEFTVELLNSLWAFGYIKDLYLESIWQTNSIKP